MSEKALLAVSFGTSVPGAEAAILNVESALRAAFPDREFGRAYTSRIICRKLASQGRPVPSPEEAFEAFAAKGVKDLAVQPTHLIFGDEFDKLCRIAGEYAGRFERLTVGRPLVDGTEDLLALAKAVLARAPAEDAALLLMGHGTGHAANLVYPALQTAFRYLGADNVFVGTVEGWPEFGDCLRELKKGPWHKAVLAPLMLVAGDHALNDMAGEEPDSWKSLLEAEGYDVSCRLEGIGSWAEIAGRYCEHLKTTLGEQRIRFTGR